MNRRLPAEWEPQDGVLLAWPHAETDWVGELAAATGVFVRIAEVISRYERVLIATPDTASAAEDLAYAGVDSSNISLHRVESNDTWAREFGPITILENDRPVLLDFGFNAWGLKFAADLDNQITARLARDGIFGSSPLRVPGLILEGGSIESDGRGTLLTTSHCLLSPNRNPHLDRRGIEQFLGELLGASRLLWLEHGYLAGDDTDAHIDTLARFAPDDTLLYVRCDDQDDEHFPALAAMEAQLQQLRTTEKKPYRLVPLPWPRPCFAPDGHRLPATYANFLVINGAVLVPTYDDPRDREALAVIGRAFPGREVIAIDCQPLIRQHGSLHCVTMQIPQGVLP